MRGQHIRHLRAQLGALCLGSSARVARVNVRQLRREHLVEERQMLSLLVHLLLGCVHLLQRAVDLRH